MTFSPEIEAALSKPDTKAGRLQRALLGLLRDRPEDVETTSARFLYYELVQTEVIPKKTEERTDGKKGRRSDQDLIDQLTRLRELGIVPWWQIVDETRSFTSWRRASTIADYLIQTLDVARIDPWGGNCPAILTESRSLSGVLHSLASRHLVDITSTNGQCRGHLHNEVAPNLREGQRIIYLGDYDKQGGDIEDHTRRVLERLVGQLDWTRLAITKDQAAALVAQGMPMIQKLDKRTGEIHDAMETEALGQQEIVRIVREHLEDMLPEPLEVVRRREAQQRRDVAAFLRRMGRGS